MTMPNIQVLRILDANLDRAREGLRVIEEWCRFGLNHSESAALCKQLRQELGAWHHPELKWARDTPNDVGTTLTHPQEEHRTDAIAVVQANLGRVQEALRVLEEYGKVYDSTMGNACKQMRYQVYSLESVLFPPERFQLLRQTQLYLVTCPEEGLGQSLNATVEAALQGGIKLVQYRDKDAEDPVRLNRATALRLLCRQYNALFIVNDRVDLALAVDADGVHLGQEDLPVEAARRLLGAQKIIGRSTTNPTELERAMGEGVDYVGVGPVYATPTKINKAIAGLDYVRHAAARCTLPWFAIGGIESQTLDAVRSAGATRVAVVRAIMQASDPTAATQQLLRNLDGNTGATS